MKDLSFACTNIVVLLGGSFISRLIPCLNEVTEVADFTSLVRCMLRYYYVFFLTCF